MEGGVGGKRLPVMVQGFRGNSLHGLFPVGAVNGDGRGLDGALDEEAELVAALGGPGNLFAVPEEVKFLVADKALAGQRFATTGGQFGDDAEFGKSEADPVVDAAVTFLGLESMPFAPGREGGAIGPIHIMGDNAAAGGAADERAQRGEGGDFGVFLEVAEGGGGFGPTVEAQQGSLQARHGGEHGFVERHVQGGVARTGVEKEKIHFAMDGRKARGARR